MFCVFLMFFVLVWDLTLGRLVPSWMACLLSAGPSLRGSFIIDREHGWDALWEINYRQYTDRVAAVSWVSWIHSAATQLATSAQVTVVLFFGEIIPSAVFTGSGSPRISQDLPGSPGCPGHLSDIHVDGRGIEIMFVGNQRWLQSCCQKTKLAGIRVEQG